MRTRALILLVVVACLGAATLRGQSSPAVDLSSERTLLGEAEAARQASDYATARAKIAEALASLLARPESEQDAEWLGLLDSAGLAAYYAQDVHGSNTAWQRVLEVRTRTLPDEHPDLQRARLRAAIAIKALGDLAGARALEEQVLEVYSRTLPDDHADLQSVRMNLALTIKNLGDLAGARALEEQVLEVRSRTLPDDDPRLQMVRTNLSITMAMLGDLAGARKLQEAVLEVNARTLPDDHPDLQIDRMNLAETIRQLGDLAAARALQLKVLEVYSRTLPDDHPTLQKARQNLGTTTYLLGDIAGARDLFERVLADRSRTLPDDHPDLQAARQCLAAALTSLGDLAGARVLQEQMLAVRSRTLPDEHPDLQAARMNLAVTLYSLGDLAGARALQEQALEVYSRTLPDDHPDLQLARQGLAVMIRDLGDLTGARALQEKVLEVGTRTLPADNPALQTARTNLAETLRVQGELARARGLQEQVLEVLARTRPEDDSSLQLARQNYAGTLFLLGDLARARELAEQVLEVRSRTRPDEHPDLQLARTSLALMIAGEVARARQATGAGTSSETSGDERTRRCVELIGALCRAQVSAAREAILGSPAREAEERCWGMADELDVTLSFAVGFGASEPLRALEAESFSLAETTRGAAVVSAELTRKAAGSPGYGELRAALGAASDELAALAQKGTTSAEFDRARAKRESVERELVALARELSGGRESGLELEAAALAAQLDAVEAAVSFRRFKRMEVRFVDQRASKGQHAVRLVSADSLCAFVVRSSKTGAPGAGQGALTLVDLGPVEPIEAEVREWRAGLGVGSDSRGVAIDASAASTSQARDRGAALRARLFDPLVPALAGVKHVVVVLDDIVHLVALDALPFDEHSLLGDHWQFETRTTLTELLRAPGPSKASEQLVAFGDVDYGAAATPGGTPRSTEDAGILGGGAWSAGFSALPGTGVEVHGIAQRYGERFGAQAEAEVYERAGATRERLLAVAPQARWLHIATHGWFARESIRSWSDPAPLDEHSGLGARLSGTDQVRGMSPMLLCGLALAGADAPEDASGRVPGLLTADELSTLDLTNCELVVLSACDTNVGERRGGQGVASLQRALQMAGARSVITSLWKVPDEATKDLMLEFYRRIWIEKQPKWQALWAAKTMLREAKDESGAPLYTTRDWAAWVLTGEPD